MRLAAVFPPMAAPFRDDEVDEATIAGSIAKWLGANAHARASAQAVEQIRTEHTAR